jgi:Concanavalin A-like lectin/glucanases superfamily
MARVYNGTVANRLSVADATKVNIVGTACSVHAWVKCTNVSATRGILNKVFTSTHQYIFTILNSGGARIQWGIGNGSATDAFNSGGVVPLGSWVSVAAVKDGNGAGTLRTYLNGALDSTNTSNNSMATQTTNPCTVGAQTTILPFLGNIGDVAIWDVALTAAEFLALAKGVSPLALRRDHLRGYWIGIGLSNPEPDLSGLVGHASVLGTVPAAADGPPVGPLDYAVAI